MLIEVKVEVKVKVEQVQEFKGVPILESRGMIEIMFVLNLNLNLNLSRGKIRHISKESLPLM